MIKIEISSSDKSTVFKNISRSESYPSPGDKYNPLPNLELTYVTGMGANFSTSEAILFLAGVVVGIPINVISNFIYDGIKDVSGTKLFINGIEIPIDEDKIQEVLKILLKP